LEHFKKLIYDARTDDHKNSIIDDFVSGEDKLSVHAGLALGRLDGSDVIGPLVLGGIAH
jgi:hypothetical protein